MAEDGSPLINVSRRSKGDEEEELRFFEKFIQPCLAEFLGTTLFVYIGTMSTQDELVLATAIAHGLTMALLIYGIGSISGGHFNPAVTLGVGLSSGMPWILMPFYVLAQLSGGILGAGVMRGCLSFPGNVSGISDNATVYYKVMGGATTLYGNPNYEATVGVGILTETILTYLLVLTVLVTTVDTKTKTNMNGLAIGLAIAVSIISGGSITGASMNPARSFGPAVVISDLRREVWRGHYIYWVGPLLGSCFATAMYRFLLAHRDRRPIRI